MEAVSPDEEVRRFLARAVEHSHLVGQHRAVALQLVSDQSSGSVFAPAHLRDEAAADVFACELLLRSLVEINFDKGERGVDPVDFAVEHAFAMNAIGLLERCKRLAAFCSARTPPSIESFITLILQSELIHFRMAIARIYLDHTLASLAFQAEFPTDAQIGALDAALDEAAAPIEERFERIAAGFSRAVGFVTTAPLRPVEPTLLETFRQGLLSFTGSFARMETEEFCKFAGSMGIKGRLLDLLARIAADPGRSVEQTLKEAQANGHNWSA